MRVQRLEVSVRQDFEHSGESDFMRQTCAIATLIILLLAQSTRGQNDLSRISGFEKYQRVGKAIRETASAGRVRNVIWSPDGKSLRFTRQGTQYVLQFQDMHIEPYKASADNAATPEPRGDSRSAERRRQRRGNRPGRAQQSTTVYSPDGKWVAQYRDFNVYLEPVTDASDKPEDESQARRKQKPVKRTSPVVNRRHPAKTRTMRSPNRKQSQSQPPVPRIFVTGLHAGSTARNCFSLPPCGGRPTVASWRCTKSMNGT